MWSRPSPPRPQPTRGSRSASARRCAAAPRAGLRMDRSREEPLASPTVARASVDDTLMEARGPLLPELDEQRPDAEAGPVFRPRHRAGETLRRCLDQALERSAAFQRRGLPRRPGAELALASPGPEIGIGFGRRDRRRWPLDANLTLQGFPMKAQRGTRVVGKLKALATVEIGVKDETADVGRLDENHAQ